MMGIYIGGSFILETDSEGIRIQSNDASIESEFFEWEEVRDVFSPLIEQTKKACVEAVREVMDAEPVSIILMIEHVIMQAEVK